MAVTPQFNETIHAPLRLRICGMLRHVERLEFAVVRDTLGVSDATLSKHLKVLSDADLITVNKEASHARSDARRLTWIGLTRAGTAALAGHMAALAEIAG